jgi:hypothetical protein
VPFQTRHFAKKASIAALTAVAIGTLFQVWLERKTPSVPVQITRVQISSLSAAAEAFWVDFGRYPSSQDEFVTNAKSKIYITPPPPWLDGWKRQIVYEQLTNPPGYRIISYGRDRSPGGTGDDADIRHKVRF